jgi:transcriptional regulator with XRE-family HTH domain
MAAAEDIAERFGANLKRARRLVCLSQEQVSLRASLHRTHIGMLEQGERLPRIDTLIKLMGAVEADAADLLDGIAWVPGNLRIGQFAFASVPSGRTARPAGRPSPHDGEPAGEGKEDGPRADPL